MKTHPPSRPVPHRPSRAGGNPVQAYASVQPSSPQNHRPSLQSSPPPSFPRRRESSSGLRQRSTVIAPKSPPIPPVQSPTVLPAQAGIQFRLTPVSTNHRHSRAGGNPVQAYASVYQSPSFPRRRESSSGLRQCLPITVIPAQAGI